MPKVQIFLIFENIFTLNTLQEFFALLLCLHKLMNK